MKSTQPTTSEREELIAFLPRLYGEGAARPAEGHARVDAGSTASDPRTPRHAAVVEEFFRVASKACWCDYGYNPGEARRMLDDEALVSEADLEQVKTMLTFCVRGERFCEGHWGMMVERGHIRRLLLRLADLEDRFGRTR